MTKAIQIHHHGGAEVLGAARVHIPQPGVGEVQLRQSFAGVNYIDIYHRTGLYPVPRLPAVLGVEAVGIVEAIGTGVTSVKVGDRVAYAMQLGGYAEARVIPADQLAHVPDGVPDEAASAVMLRGLTAHMLVHRVYSVGPGTTVLVHAAAGGLGQIVSQWAKYLGATVIGTVGSRDKVEVASATGVDHVILYRESDFVADVRSLTGGRGVDVAYEGIGGDNLIRTFDAVRPFGTVASVGQASGTVPPIELTQLGPARSIALARPSIRAYVADPATYRAAAIELLQLVGSGALRVNVGAVYPLDQAAQAHVALEGRQTTGSILLAL